MFENIINKINVATNKVTEITKNYLITKEENIKNYLKSIPESFSLKGDKYKDYIIKKKDTFKEINEKFTFCLIGFTLVNGSLSVASKLISKSNYFYDTFGQDIALKAMEINNNIDLLTNSDMFVYGSGIIVIGKIGLNFLEKFEDSLKTDKLINSSVQNIKDLCFNNRKDNLNTDLQIKEFLEYQYKSYQKTIDTVVKVKAKMNKMSKENEEYKEHFKKFNDLDPKKFNDLYKSCINKLRENKKIYKEFEEEQKPIDEIIKLLKETEVNIKDKEQTIELLSKNILKIEIKNKLDPQINILKSQLEIEENNLTNLIEERKERYGLKGELIEKRKFTNDYVKKLFASHEGEIQQYKYHQIRDNISKSSLTNFGLGELMKITNGKVMSKVFQILLELPKSHSKEIAEIITKRENIEQSFFLFKLQELIPFVKPATIGNLINLAREKTNNVKTYFDVLKQKLDTIVYEVNVDINKKREMIDQFAKEMDNSFKELNNGFDKVLGKSISFINQMNKDFLKDLGFTPEEIKSITIQENKLTPITVSNTIDKEEKEIKTNSNIKINR